MSPAAVADTAAAIFAESIGPAIVRFHADARARQLAVPSLAIPRRVSPRATSAKDWRAVPQFTSVRGGRIARIEIDPGTSLYGTGEVAGPLLRNGLTITCWAKRNGVSDFWNMIYSHPNDLGLPTAGVSVPVTGIGFGNDTLRNNQLGFYNGDLANTGSFGWAPSPTLLMPEQQWTFLAMTVDATNNLVIYQNGKSATNNVAYGTHDFNTVASFIGKKQKYFGFGGVEVNGFRGTIDEVAIYDKALSKAQILQLFDAAEVPPIILVQPQAPPPPVYEGQSLSLSVTADVTSSTTPLAYQWTKNGIPIPGKTTTNYTVSSLVTNHSGSYAVVITNNHGAVTSSIVALVVQAGPPVFVQKPQPIQRFAGGTATFTSVVVGSSPLSYQWSFNNVPISGATSSAYTINQVGTGDVGNYSVLVSNVFGSATRSKR